MSRWFYCHKGSFINTCFVFGMVASPYAFPQKVIVRDVDVIYGSEVVSGKHQIVIASPPEVSIVPAEKKKEFTLGPNVVVGSKTNGRFYLEESEIAEREQKIYREVNRRTKDAPFTVLFTGNIPAEIQAKRLQLMPEIGVFGNQLDKINKDRAANQTEEKAAEDDPVIPENVPGVQILGSDDPTKGDTEDQNEDALLEKLIGG
ncbi:hypothetical protein [Marinomonas sp. 2405UD68-3]|uniref:hypothetical protein n=1 Tax=Marinomonas sp. 2405UD68-3 TaxID=3391835 RepID=UPI0039C9A874